MAPPKKGSRKRKRDSADNSTPHSHLAKHHQIEDVTSVTPIQPAVQKEHLPAELLENILGRILIRSEPIYLLPKRFRRLKKVVNSLRRAPEKQAHNPYELLKSLLIRKDFYSAGVEIFYGENEFLFRDFDLLEAFLREVGTDRKNCIRRLRFDLIFDNHYHAKRCLSRLVEPSASKESASTGKARLEDDTEDAAALLSLKLLEELPKLEKITIAASYRRDWDWQPLAEPERLMVRYAALLREAWGSEVELVASIEGILRDPLAHARLT